MLLAEFVPLSAGAQWTIVSLLGVAVALVTIHALTRRKPPLDSELVKLSLMIAGLQTSVGELNETVKVYATHAAEIETLRDKVRALEQHREEDQRGNRAYTRESSERVFKKIDELAASVSKNFQSVERAIGQLEGKISPRITVT